MKDPHASQSPLPVFSNVFEEFASEDAIIEDGVARSYGWLQAERLRSAESLQSAGITRGSIVSLETDFSAAAVATLLALIDLGAIVAPLGPGSAANHDALLELGQIEWRVRLMPGSTPEIHRTERTALHPLYTTLRKAASPGLVLFTSGSTGQPKAAVHDMTRLLIKYRTRRHRYRTLMFLLFDHIGGIDTLLYTLSNGGTAVVTRDRSPNAVCRTIAEYRVEVLPAAPSFLTVMLLGEADRRHDMSSLRYITYGAEVMPQSTLSMLSQRFPEATILQKYGLTELGTLRSRSRSNNSLWVKVGGDGFDTRVRNGQLEIKAQSSMLGYLNAPSPFTEDGWFMTGDDVEVDGEYIRILGRASDIINVGGQKVYPAEVESVIQELDNIAEVAVVGEAHPFTGRVVVARVRLRDTEDGARLERRVRGHCRERLESYKVPVRVEVTTDTLHTERHKTARGT